MNAPTVRDEAGADSQISPGQCPGHRCCGRTIGTQWGIDDGDVVSLEEGALGGSWSGVGWSRLPWTGGQERCMRATGTRHSCTRRAGHAPASPLHSAAAVRTRASCRPASVQMRVGGGSESQAGDQTARQPACTEDSPPGGGRTRGVGPRERPRTPLAAGPPCIQARGTPAGRVAGPRRPGERWRGSPPRAGLAGHLGRTERTRRPCAAFPNAK